MQQHLNDKRQVKNEGPLGEKGQEAKRDTPIDTQILVRPILIGDLTLASPTTQTTIGANGAATALTANPVGYLTVMIGNTAYQLPYYNVA